MQSPVKALIPLGATILVTGANGFIASHVVHQLLEDGYNVRGSVRSEDKGSALQDSVSRKYGTGRLEIVVVRDIAEEGAFDEAVEGVAGIIHLATAAFLTTEPDQVIPATVAGALSVFKAAAKSVSPTVRSMVYTSDSFAAYLPQPDKEIRIDEWTYNEEAVKAVNNPDSSKMARIRKRAWIPKSAVEWTVYAAAKVAAEKAVWRFVSKLEEKPTYQVSTILPNINFGAAIPGLQLSSTGTCIPTLLRKGPTSDLLFPAQHFINVRDCAKLHIAALVEPSQADRRVFAMTAPFNWNDVLAIVRKLCPEKDMRENLEGLGKDLSVVPNGPAEELLRRHYGHGWTGLEESVRENIDG